ncbi:MAG: lamin tail domain-containing protein, partial [Parvicellaceae bacterium]
MNKFYTLILSILTLSLNLNAQITDLFISEYSEGSSNNKYIEIYNGTGADVSLANYEIWKVANGGTWPENTLPLTGTLTAGEVYVIYNSSSNTSIAAEGDLTWSQANYNGDDAIGLAKSINGTMTLIDAVGTDGPDPGSGWDVGGFTNATANKTLVRKSSVTSGNTNWTLSAGTNSTYNPFLTTDSEWIVYPQDTWTYLGSHSYSSAPTPISCGSAIALTPGTAQSGNTSTFGDPFDVTPCLGNYDGGDDALFYYTAANTGDELDITISNVAGWSGAALHADCL